VRVAQAHAAAGFVDEAVAQRFIAAEVRLHGLDDLDLVETAMAHFVDRAHPAFAELGDDFEPAVDLGEDGHLRWKRKSTPSWKADCSGAKVGTAELTRSSEVSALTTSRCTRDAGTTPFCFFSASISAAVKRELCPDGSSAPDDSASRARRCLVVSTYLAHCAALSF